MTDLVLVPALWAPNGREYAREVVAQYEAATWSTARSAVTDVDQGAARDLSRFTRQQLRDRSRYFWKNSAFIRGLIERLVVYTIGVGITPVSRSSDDEWSKRANSAFREWSWYPLVDSKATFGAYQRAMFRSRLVEGEHFTLLTYGDSGRPRLQALEAGRITSNTAATALHDDGVDYDASGRPWRYHVGTRDQIGIRTFTQVPASAMVHNYSVARPGQRRGEPVLSAALNTAHDVDDILALEKQAVKQASGKTDVIKTASGEANPAEIRAARLSGASIAVGVTDPTKAIEYYKPMLGAAPVYMRKGEEFTQYTSQRPGNAWQGFMDFLSETVCLSTGIPPSVLLQIKVGGADTRRDLACAARVFEIWQADVISELQDVWEYVIGAEIASGFLPPPPSDWRETVRWYPPKVITVDSGREAQQDRDDVAAALMSEEEYCLRYQIDPSEHRALCAREARERKEFILAEGLTVDEYIKLRGLKPATASATSQQQQAAGAQNG